jgi:hypothetical protein
VVSNGIMFHSCICHEQKECFLMLIFAPSSRRFLFKSPLVLSPCEFLKNLSNMLPNFPLYILCIILRSETPETLRLLRPINKLKLLKSVWSHTKKFSRGNGFYNFEKNVKFRLNFFLILTFFLNIGHLFKKIISQSQY